MIEFSNPERVGPYLPHFWSEADPRSAAEQADANYRFGGWEPFSGFTLLGTSETVFRLAYPGDPQMTEIARASFRGGFVVLFQSDWVAIISASGSFEVSRMD